MREKFDSVNQLFGYYVYLKHAVVSIPAIMPKEDNGSYFFSLSSKYTREEHLAFIGDIENYIKHYADNHQQGYVKIPVDCLHHIFMLKMRLSKFQSYGQLAKHFHRRIKRGEELPRRLRYREHICDIANDMEEKSERYFVDKGILTVTNL